MTTQQKELITKLKSGDAKATQAFRLFMESIRTILLHGKTWKFFREDKDCQRIFKMKFDTSKLKVVELVLTRREKEKKYKLPEYLEIYKSLPNKEIHKLIEFFTDDIEFRKEYIKLKLEE